MCKLFALCAVALLAYGSPAATQTICEACCAPDQAEVVAIGAVRDLDVSSKGWANFTLVDSHCGVHVFWDFQGAAPLWLQDGANVSVEGTYWVAHPKHTWEPEVVAMAVSVCSISPEASAGSAPSADWTMTPWGASGEVAGSCYEVATPAGHFLVDCGSYMTRDDMPSEGTSCRHDDDPFPFDAATIDSVLVTHAHDDHVGRIHYLIAQGFRGTIHMTEVTARLYDAKLGDTLFYAKLSSQLKAEVQDALATGMVVRHDYDEPFEVIDGVTATFVNAGHIPGSASVLLDFSVPDGSEAIAFSGDVGSGHHPFLNNPDTAAFQELRTATLVVESTYGASPPRTQTDDAYAHFYAVLQAAVDAGQLVVIPTFALDRTQVVLATLLDGLAAGRLSLPKKIGVGGRSGYYLTDEYIRMHADTALCSRYFSTNSDGFCSQEPLAGRGTAWEFVRSSVSDTSRETPAQAWNYSVVVTPSGTGASSYAAELIDAYRDDPRVVFLQVGWVPPESALGELATSQGDAKVLDARAAFSGHADISGLLAYIGAFPELQRVIVTHGDDAIGARAGLAAEIAQAFPQLQVLMPQYGQSLPLLGEQPAG